MLAKPRLKRRAAVVQLFFLGGAFVLGVVMIWKRVGAEQPPKQKPAGRALVAVLAPASGSAAPAPSTAPSASAARAPAASASAAPAPSSSAKGGDDGGVEDQIETAVLGPDGGVPVHKEGPFRS